MERNEIHYGSTEVKPQSPKLEVKAEEKILSVKDVEEQFGVLKTCVEEVADFTIIEDVKMKVAYKPSEFFCLRDLHHAVNNLPADAFVPEFSNDVAVSCCDVHLSSVLSDKVLYSWGDNEDVGRKVIVISSCLLEDIDSATKDNINGKCQWPWLELSKLMCSCTLLLPYWIWEAMSS
ncbi:hypothetical protein Tco_0153144 [Tanacetum coccineum]